MIVVVLVVFGCLIVWHLIAAQVFFQGARAYEQRPVTPESMAKGDRLKRIGERMVPWVKRFEP